MKNAEITIDGNNQTYSVPKNKANCKLGEYTISMKVENIGRYSGHK